MAGWLAAESDGRCHRGPPARPVISRTDVAGLVVGGLVAGELAGTTGGCAADGPAVGRCGCGGAPAGRARRSRLRTIGAGSGEADRVTTGGTVAAASVLGRGGPGSAAGGSVTNPTGPDSTAGIGETGGTAEPTGVAEPAGATEPAASVGATDPACHVGPAGRPEPSAEASDRRRLPAAGARDIRSATRSGTGSGAVPGVRSAADR
ncbi:conserved hypothetical membrane protein, IniB [Parafrankia sp. EAN1pec]|nr:conserved hypothetical membrane protein, IniB [Frankia sp. EAN1pec]